MLSKNQLGFFYMFISVCAFSLMDVIVKWSDDYPVGQVLFFRGFCGGNNAETNYKEVCSGTTNHAEVVKLDFDPKVISYEMKKWSSCFIKI